jgi:hypothetical protein
MTRFDAARRSALVGDLLSHLLGRPADLLPFDAVRERLELANVVDRGLAEVPLDRIVGSVQRDREFTREFFPREEKLRERWEAVEGMARGAPGFAPVELYKVGDLYFVVDGHHRVSVARAVGAPAIEARVKEFETPVPLPADASTRDVLVREGLARFLEATGLVPANPDEFRVTEPGGYERLLDHIAVHRHYRGNELARHVPWEEAVASWRDTVYRPIVATIRASGILEKFPERTETDLYLWVMDHLHLLREKYGRAAHPSRVVRHLLLSRAPRRSNPLERLRSWWRSRRGTRGDFRG